MAKILPNSVLRLIDEFAKLPGIGPKSASRLTFYLLNKPESDLTSFGQSILDLKKNLKICKSCFSITEDNPCVICSDPKRDKTILMIVEEPLDIVALEKTGFSGFYHVLGGVISPIEGIGPENLRISEIYGRIKKGGIEEVILATDPSLEGEATSMYIAKEVDKINQKGLKITRIARGLPVGGDLEYADEITLTRALEGRKEY